MRQRRYSYLFFIKGSILLFAVVHMARRNIAPGEEITTGDSDSDSDSESMEECSSAMTAI